MKKVMSLLAIAVVVLGGLEIARRSLSKPTREPITLAVRVTPISFTCEDGHQGKFSYEATYYDKVSGGTFDMESSLSRNHKCISEAVRTYFARDNAFCNCPSKALLEERLQEYDRELKDFIELYCLDRGNRLVLRVVSVSLQVNGSDILDLVDPVVEVHLSSLKEEDG